MNAGESFQKIRPKSSRAKSMTWFRELKFAGNPLDVRPNSNLVGLERQEAQLQNHIKKEHICFLNGLTGSGKTSLLMKIQKEMKGHKFIYLDAHDLPKDFNLSMELRNKRSFFDRLWLRNSPSKKPVLIIDEFQATDPDVVLEARAKWEHPDKKKIRSIVISQISKELDNVTPSFKERLGSRIIMMDELDEEELKEVLRRRLYNPRTKVNFIDKFKPDALKFLINCSGANPRRLLEYTDEIFDFHFRKFRDRNPILLDSYNITVHATKEILGLDKVHVDGFEHLDERKTQLQKYMRVAPDVDTFEQRYSKRELTILRYMKTPKTMEQIAKRLKVSIPTATKYMQALRKSKSVLKAGKKQNKVLWQVAPAVKRQMVKV